ncbi:hypothetical protein QBC42DRAFT_269091 [Cladorrhinum samala]|uniref:Uncharacterized protein n=1 Tax=Cladorrhinum samala TaxID=585594 RepID=A0AAV9HP72_9PEZI|nr:hypothetical protein QBC42DRAFT_269091 [Cladorrhinum samala]
MAKKSKNKSKNSKPQALEPKRPKIVDDFEKYFGKGDLEDWQRLCDDIGLEGDFESITKCRKAIKSVYVNIYDLLDAVKKGEHPQHFPDLETLIYYSFGGDEDGCKKIYPKRHVKDHLGPVKALLRPLTRGTMKRVRAMRKAAREQAKLDGLVGGMDNLDLGDQEYVMVPRMADAIPNRY